MEFTVICLFDCVGVAVGIGLGGLILLRRQSARMGVASLLAALLGLFVPAFNLPLAVSPWAWLRPPGVGAHFVTILCLLLIALGLVRLNRWLAAAGLVVLYGLDVSSLFGFYPIYGWGLIAVPPLFAGLLLATTPARRRVVQAGLVFGWLLVILVPATLALVNTIDQFEWERARAATGYFPDRAPEQLAALAVAQQREVVATAIYLLITLVTLSLISVVVVERLVDAPKRSQFWHSSDKPLRHMGDS